MSRIKFEFVGQTQVETLSILKRMAVLAIYDSHTHPDGPMLSQEFWEAFEKLPESIRKEIQGLSDDIQHPPR